jgi:pimeloyl-ACP methyl ester carboxylesterase
MRTYRARGWAKTIATMASRWLGMADATHSGYVHNIVTHANLVPMAVPTPTPEPVPPPAPVPPPPPPPPKYPPIPLTPTIVDGASNVYDWVAPVKISLGGLPALELGTTGPIFVLIHGGPLPIGEGRENDLQALGNRLAAKGGHAFCIDYRSDSWEHAVADITEAVSDVRKLATGRVTLVAHSFGGLPTSIAFLRDGIGDAYVGVNAISSAAGYSGSLGGVPDPAPDPIQLAALRPSAPVTVIRGQSDNVASADNKEGFIRALNAAGHPGLNNLCPGDHTGPLFTESTTTAIFATAKLI